MKKMLVGAVAVASMVSLAGCGSATDISSSAGGSLTKANFASAMTSATTDVKSLHMLMNARAQGQQITMDADVAAPNGLSSGGSFAETMKQMSMAMTMAMPGGKSIEMRLVKGVMYVKASGLGMSLGSGGKSWVKFDLNDSSNPLGSMFSSMSSLDPAAITKQFQGLTSLHKVGPETVDGVAAVHYRVSIDTSKASDLLGGLGSGADLSALPQQLTYDVWVDSEARPVKIVMNMAQISMDMHFSKWNQPVTVVAPPASEVSDYSS